MIEIGKQLSCVAPPSTESGSVDFKVSIDGGLHFIDTLGVQYSYLPALISFSSVEIVDLDPLAVVLTSEADLPIDVVPLLVNCRFKYPAHP